MRVADILTLHKAGRSKCPIVGRIEFVETVRPLDFDRRRWHLAEGRTDATGARRESVASK